MKFIPTEIAKANPRHLKLANGKRVGIGGAVVIIRTPPKLNETVPEATPEEYEEVYCLGGYNHLINPVTETKKKKATDYAIQSDKPDTGSAEGPTEAANGF